MDIFHLIILAILAIVIGQIRMGRSLALLCASALVIYWLQPFQDYVNLIYWLPTATLAMTVFVWLLTSTPENRSWRRNWQAAAVLIGVVVLVAMNRYFKLEQVFVTETPRLQWVGLMILIVLAAVFGLSRLNKFPAALFVITAIGLVILLTALKMPSVLITFFETASAIRGKEAGNTSVISWLGFSYVSFRLLHTIIDRWAGRLPSATLTEYVNYVIFFPSFTAGPIDRLERFTRDLNNPVVLDREGWVDAGGRIITGMFKKFVIADALAWIALTDLLARDTNSTGWMWILLYAYSFRIYFDFSGYTDIAIGLGRLLGVRLPENFAAPYLKPSLTQFWNSWHMTLTQWFRSYFFNPLTRVLRSSDRPLPVSLIILITQITTMILIGLWHGITTSFVLWGLWHGFGLFVQNRWSAIVRERESSWKESIFAQMTLKYSGMFLTFNFISLGWLFFALSTPALVWSTMLKLFGVQ